MHWSSPPRDPRTAPPRCGSRSLLPLGVWLLLLGSALRADAQDPLIRAGAQDPLEEYVRIGLRQNLGLQQRELAIARAEAVVRESRGWFLPSATVNARHTDVQGRVVNLGELINPAFAALNQLIGQPQFPTDIDLRLPLRQETSVRLAQPLFQPAILHGYRATAAARDAEEATRDASVRAVAAGIRATYLEHAKARRLAELRAATRELVEEQVRVVSRLVEVGSATPDALSRVRAERSEALQREAEAGQLVQATAQSFNLMLARPLTDTIIVPDDDLLAPGPLPPLEEVLAHAATTREELRALEAARRSADAQVRVAQGGYLPAVSVALDYGVQGNEYRFSRDADFTLVTVVASWNLFNGGRDAARAQQSRLDARRYTLEREDVRRGIELQVRLAWQAAAVAQAAIATATDQRAAAARTWELVRRRAEEGLASPLELSEARTQLTAAEINLVFTRYDHLLRRVELERAAATREEGR